VDATKKKKTKKRRVFCFVFFAWGAWMEPRTRRAQLFLCENVKILLWVFGFALL